MKTLYAILIMSTITLASCKKETKKPSATDTTDVNNGPYGVVSKWESVGGDSIYEEELTLTLFYTEKHSPCDICHYQLNYALWNDYEYTYSASKCAIPKDTLVMTDLATAKQAFFKRVNH